MVVSAWSGRRVLVVPMQPTPNGRLHLGHASGPYLRSDVLARALRRAGAAVRVITGSDVYENWVLLDSHRRNARPEETCARFGRLIREDLSLLGSGLDDYVDPLDPAHHDAYREVHDALIDRLAARGTARRETHPYPVATGSGRYVVGVWLLGRCPACGGEGGGNCCEACGYHYQPCEILEPRSRLDEGALEWRDETCWFMVPPSPDAVLDGIEAQAIDDGLRRVARRYVEQTGGRIQLTVPGEWGMRGRNCTATTVLWNTFYAYSLYCGEVYRRAEGLDAGPFAPDSGVTVVGAFGIDNAIAGVVGPVATALAHGELKPFDHVLTNYFLDLEGQKFSTSREHGIWIALLLSETSVTRDELRYCLAHRCPETAPDDFLVDDFVERVNRLRRLHATTLRPALERSAAAGPPPAAPAGLARRLEAALARQDAWLVPDRLGVRSAVEVVDDWLRDAPQEAPGDSGRGEVYWWLKGLALLAEPLMPDLAGGLWRALGAPGRPRTGAVFERTGPLGPAAARGLLAGAGDPLTSAEVLACTSLAPEPEPIGGGAGA